MSFGASRRIGFEPTSESKVLSLLGGFDVHGGMALAPLPLSVQRLVAYLGIHRRRQSRDRLAEWLWPGRPRDRARSNLRQAILQERRAGHELICTSGKELWLSPSVAVDLHMVVADVHALLASPAEVAADFDLSKLVHDLLPAWEEDWLEGERERFRELRLHGIETISEYWLLSGRTARAIEAAQMAVAVDPLRESARALLIRAHVAERNVAPAVHVYESYRDVLERELSAQPSAELLKLVIAVRRG